MNIKPIKNNRECREGLKEIDRLIDAPPNTPNGDRLDVLVTLVEAREQQHWPIDSPDP
jgi:HTH-type transcriptional regulator / antitoxin HigA